MNPSSTSRVTSLPSFELTTSCSPLSCGTPFPLAPTIPTPPPRTGGTQCRARSQQSLSKALRVARGKQQDGFSPHLALGCSHQLVPCTTDAVSNQCSQKGQLHFNPDNGSSNTSCFPDITYANSSCGLQRTLARNTHLRGARVLRFLPMNR